MSRIKSGVFFHIPLNFGQIMVRNMEKIQKAGASAKEIIVLSDEKSMWGSNVYIAVEKDFPGSDSVRISGTFLTKVFEGPYKDTGKWMREMNAFVTLKGKTAKKTYLFYTTCPKCAQSIWQELRGYPGRGMKPQYWMVAAIAHS